MELMNLLNRTLTPASQTLPDSTGKETGKGAESA
jgi:hypothetical protein